ncbi:MAG: 2-oxoacid:acceptor oxidoreductase family protein [Desulfatiglans sp.]|jgi:2-oxoglutarate ferredoxin oxidoreductase subunit gamma|nr:2-oxoacid:acceptor oxidoreductase family protein [Thermodesulfobacteriota bacterium]MEE4351981.1 2-oxoacid:acceptor oxidoreductase family protein [Desulfatiglans sp.]
MSYNELIVAGLGGQGALIIGRFLAEAASSVHKYSSFFPNYGPTMRGGECECTVIFSDKEVPAPTVMNPFAVILMGVRAGANAVEEFVPRVRTGGVIIVDSSAPIKIDREDIDVYRIEANQIAKEIGNSQVANFVFLGAYLGATGAVALDTVEKLMEEKMGSGKKKKYLDLNKTALRQGAKATRG